MLAPSLCIPAPSAIPTMYEGTVYRSRLEARWGQFFHLLDEPAHYEAEGYELPSGRYVPDFYLPRQGLWLEIKPAQPNERAETLCAELCERTGEPVVCMFGPFGVWLDKQAVRYWQSGLAFLPDAGPGGEVSVRDDDRYWPAKCPFCGAFGFSFEGKADRVCRNGCNVSGKVYGFEDAAIVKAIRLVNSYRFWR